MEIFEKLSPFMLRAGIVCVGRERLHQLSKKLAFLLVTEELSERSIQELLTDFQCPVYQYLTLHSVERYFGFYGTKVVGFQRHTLSSQLMKALHGYEIRRSPRVPLHSRVAVLGASGIGRFHANWWHLEGAEPVAFLGSSPDSIAETKKQLGDSFGFSGRGYDNLEELLASERPDIVDVCLPPRLHYAAVKTALESGCHVLCEKPFVYTEGLTRDEMIGQARELGRLAEEKKRALGISIQYVMAGREVFRLWRESHPDEVIRSFEGMLVSPTRGRAPNPLLTWVDLAPHLLGVAQVLCHQGVLDLTTLQKRSSGSMAEAEFDCRTPDDTVVHCRITTDHRDIDQRNIRQLTLNGALYDIGGFLDDNHVYQMDVKTPEGHVLRPDMMRLMIRDFLHGRVGVPAKMACQNMEWLLDVIEALQQ